MGLVKITLCFSLRASAMAYLGDEDASIRAASAELVIKQRNVRSTWTHSAHTVLPAEVCADTRTDSLLSIHKMASRWKGSRINGYSCSSDNTG